MGILDFRGISYSIFEEKDNSFSREIVIDFRDEENCAGGVLDGESVRLGRLVMFIDELINRFVEIVKYSVLAENQRKPE